MRDWTVAGGLILGDAGLLLVRNRRRNGSHDWSPPGGVIEPTESMVAGLTREVVEETGVEVDKWDGPVYEVHVEAPDMGWRLKVEAHLALAYRGELRLGDPDGIVVEAAWVDPAGCGERLLAGHPWVREPVVTWLEAHVGNGGTGTGTGVVAGSWLPRTFRYHVTGKDPATAVVTSLD
jgi:8-oxo-dGTP pyrophosphatase MutT (NUDIX family)